MADTRYLVKYRLCAFSNSSRETTYKTEELKEML